MIIHSEEKSLKEVKVSIGLPVYNGERFIRKKIESILNQTIGNFELIISDNASTDKTIKLIEDFAKKDERIRFFKHEQNMGVIENFNFVLQQAKGDYFMWTAIDDIQMPTFIEKNLEVLEKNSKVACSISKIQLYGETTDYLKLKSDDSIITKLFKQIKTGIGHLDTYAASGPYEKRIQEYLKKLPHNQIFYGMYRTDLIKKCHIQNHFLWVEGCTILNLLKFGELHVVDEILLYVYDGGMSRKGMIEVTRHMHHGILDTILPYRRFTSWCMKNLDKKIIISNINFFISINVMGVFSLFVDILRRLVNITKSEKRWNKIKYE